MKIFYIILLTIFFSTSIFSQKKNKSELDSLKNNIVQLREKELVKQKEYQLLNQLRLDSLNKNYQKENFRVIPLPPADSSNSKIELLPNSKSGDFKPKLIMKNKKDVLK